MTDEVEPRNRRGALLALFGLGAVAAVTTTAAPAKADLSFSDVKGAVTNGMNNAQITGSNAGILGILESLVTVSGSLAIPTTPMAVMRCLFDGLNLNWAFNACSAFKSNYSMQTTAALPLTMKELWSTDTPATARRSMNDEIALQHTAATEQVTESQTVSAQAAAAQGALTLEDQTTLAAIVAAASEYELISMVALLSQLMVGTNVRLSQLIMQQNAAQQTRGAALMAETYKPALAAVYRGSDNVEVGGANKI